MYNDSKMKCVNLLNTDTFTINSHTKSIMQYSDKNSNHWEGSWPEICEKVIIVTNYITEERVLFARKTENNEYRFWDPRSIPFANTIFIISK